MVTPLRLPGAGNTQPKIPNSLSGQLGNIRYGIPFDEIVAIMRQRRSQDSLLIQQMIDVRDRYNGDVILPLPDVDGMPVLDPPVPRLIAGAVDGNARQAASPNPTIVCPALSPGASRSMTKANIRRRALYAGWEEEQLRIKLYRSYRHLIGYGTCAWVVMPDDDRRTAAIELRDPLTAYPELRAPDDIRLPRNVGFVYGRSIEWITSHYPNTAGFFFKAAGKEWDTLWDVVEWIDEDELVIGILGPRMPAYSPQDSRPYGYNGFELERFRNKAGCVPAVIPRRVTLDRIMGQMATMIPSVDLHARLTALELVMAEKHIFPDLVMLSDQNATATVVSGQWKDGRTGEMNTVNNARGVQYLTTQVAPFIPAQIQQLEESIRESGGANAMMGGDNPGGLRTGRALAQMGSFAIDPTVEEAQVIMQAALTEVNRAYIEVQKGYYPSKKFVYFTGLQGDESVVEYTPKDDFDSNANSVKYPIPGADVSQMSVTVAQMVGAGLMSKRTGRVKHPFIDDPDFEEDHIALEQMQAALLGGAAQQVAQGAMPLVDAARVTELLQMGKGIVEALQTAHQEAQERQAAQPAPPGPGQGGPPGAAPGLSMPGNGAEAGAMGGAAGPPGANPIPQPPQSLANLHSLVRNLNSTPPLAPPLNSPAGGGQ